MFDSGRESRLQSDRLRTVSGHTPPQPILSAAPGGRVVVHPSRDSWQARGLVV
ncbi:hypothetical protein [Haladaptatus cibarius]|uniref:hypothetical protein n=1 Tax=Haladaptatus cibarius TaxID=453847 RepID=UPI00130E1D2C|nr:hypothetical protein [Haladaptatus cibarius]